VTTGCSDRLAKSRRRRGVDVVHGGKQLATSRRRGQGSGQRGWFVSQTSASRKMPQLAHRAERPSWASESCFANESSLAESSSTKTQKRWAWGLKTYSRCRWTCSLSRLTLLGNVKLRRTLQMRRKWRDICGWRCFARTKAERDGMRSSNKRSQSSSSRWLLSFNLLVRQALLIWMRIKRKSGRP
jgi:hypothetical protein